MLRLTLLLCVGIFAALMIAGEDRGQLRPGLAEAAAKKVLPGSEAVAGSAAPAAEAVAETAVAAAESPVDPVPQPAAEPETPLVAEAQTDAAPMPVAEPAAAALTELEEPVFTLSAIGNERVPGEAEAADAAPAVTDGTIWYVNASSVNVRAEPSTEAEIVGKLGSGEATLVVQAVNDDWARIVIQGDGVEGFVALRYLSAEAP